MIDLSHLEKYHENNRIEAKKALGGLPHSIWETYSAFANTLGGLILLGVEEYRDKSFHPVDLPDPEALVREFRELINQPGKASVNILTAKDVLIEEVNGCHIVVIQVPRALRRDKPVYVDGDLRNSYRRSGEGDYRCSPEEIEAMLRDAAVRTQDMQVLQDMTTEALCRKTLNRYRACVEQARPGSLPEALSMDEFLVQAGAAETGEDGVVRPNCAGLLMFGKPAAITTVYPDFRLEYREEDKRNVFDFCENVLARMKGSLPVPALFPAVQEALANCLVNADYLSGPVIVEMNAESISLSNPGVFRIGIDTAKSGGLSDPRNSTMMKLFRLADIGEGTGSGVPGIFRISRELGLKEPVISESLHPDRTTLSLSFEKVADPASKKRSAGLSRQKSDDPRVKERQKNDIILFLTDQTVASASGIAKHLNISVSRTNELLAALLKEGIVVTDGTGKNKKYRLRS